MDEEDPRLGVGQGQGRRAEWNMMSKELEKPEQLRKISLPLRIHGGGPHCRLLKVSAIEPRHVRMTDAT